MNQPTIKAIETRYKGYRFRSRLEARWAVFFDSLGISWEYEKEGYQLEYQGETIQYLPDFWLPELNCWFEIKGEKPTNEEALKVLVLMVRGGKSVCLAWGMPQENHIAVFPRSSYEDFLEYQERKDGPLDYLVDYCRDATTYGAFTECSECSKINVTYEDCGNTVPIPCGQNHHYANDDEQRFTPRIRRAIGAARAARFEHGERPAA